MRYPGATPLFPFLSWSPDAGFLSLCFLVYFWLNLCCCLFDYFSHCLLYNNRVLSLARRRQIANKMAAFLNKPSDFIARPSGGKYW